MKIHNNKNNALADKNKQSMATIRLVAFLVAYSSGIKIVAVVFVQLQFSSERAAYIFS